MDEKKQREVAPVGPNRVQMAENGRNIWLIDAESSENPKDFLQPEFYSHCAKNMRPFDRVEIRTDDGLYWCELIVLTADLNWAKVDMLREKNLTAVEHQSNANSEFEVSYKGQHRKWCVIRKSDKSAVSEGHADRQAATGWLETYQRTVGRKAA